MYSKQEASRLRQHFWTAFGQYMAPVLSAEGVKINWVNYKTGVRQINFYLQADTKSAAIGIALTHNEPAQRLQYYEKFLQVKRLLEDALQEEWTWDRAALDENGKEISRIYTVLPGVNIFDQADWPAIISFLKSRIIALDEFWNLARYGFEEF